MGKTCPACQYEVADHATMCLRCGITIPLVAPTPAHALVMAAQMVAKEGRKDDKGKLPYDLLPFGVIDAIVEVQKFGAKKYGPNNWQRVSQGRRRYVAAALRHISAHTQGHRYDSESGLTHLCHALCSLMYAEWIDQQHVKRHKK